MKEGQVNLYVIKEDDFRIWGGAFAIAPTTSGYTLKFSTDGVNYTDKRSVAANESVAVTDCVPGTYYKLVGNTGIVHVYYNTAVTEEDIQRAALGGGTSGGNGSSSGGTGGGTSTTPLVPTTYAELKALRDAGNLVAGQQYRITDYECTARSGDEDVRSAGHRFDVIVTADSPTTLNEDARACHHDGDAYFANCNLEAWELKYSLDNDARRFKWATEGGIESMDSYNSYGNPLKRCPQFDGRMLDEFSVYRYAWGTDDDVEAGDKYAFVYSKTEFPLPNDEVLDSRTDNITIVPPFGKGVIYWMRDEWGNECPYDFKNIMFLRYDDDTYAYTCSLQDGDTHSDMTIAQFREDWEENDHPLAYDVVMLPCRSADYLGMQELNYNVIISTEGGVYDISFGYDCARNTIGGACSRITFGNGCIQNDVSSSCSCITFGNQCLSNLISSYSNSVFLNDYCSSCSVDEQCQYVSFGVGCSRNQVGYQCKRITFGDGCENNKIISGCNSISFGSGCTNNTIMAALSEGVRFHTGVRYIYLKSSSSMTSSNHLANVEVLSGNNTFKKEIQVNLSPSPYTITIVGLSDNGVVSVKYYNFT